MKIFRYRRPSSKTVLGVTRAKRRAKRSLGISQVEGWIKPSRVKQKVKYRLGLYHPAISIIRNLSKGRVPTPFGLFTRRKKS
jgi:hypothetical protein